MKKNTWNLIKTIFCLFASVIAASCIVTGDTPALNVLLLVFWGLGTILCAKLYAMGRTGDVLDPDEDTLPTGLSVLRCVRFLFLFLWLFLYFGNAAFHAEDFASALACVVLVAIGVAGFINYVVELVKTAKKDKEDVKAPQEDHTSAIYHLECDGDAHFNVRIICEVNQEAKQVTIPAVTEEFKAKIKNLLDGNEVYNEFVIIDGKQYTLVSKSDLEALGGDFYWYRQNPLFDAE